MENDKGEKTMRQNFTIFAVTALLLCSLTACGGEKKSSGTVDGAENGTTSGMTGGGESSSDVSGELKTDPATGTRYTGRDDAPVVRYGNGYGNTNADKSATKNATPNATLHGSYNNPTGTPAGQTANRRATASAFVQDEEIDPAAAGVRYQLMLDNARVRDTDGFLFDGENAHHSTLW